MIKIEKLNQHLKSFITTFIWEIHRCIIYRDKMLHTFEKMDAIELIQNTMKDNLIHEWGGKIVVKGTCNTQPP